MNTPRFFPHRWLLLTCAFVLAGTGVARAQIVGPGVARFPQRARIFYPGGIPYGGAARARQAAMRRLARQAAMRQRVASANRRVVAVRSHKGGKSGVALGSEVSALLQRHAALATKLPPDLRRLDETQLPTVKQLPLPAQFAYLSTVEDYPTLLPQEQTRLRDLLKAMAALNVGNRRRFVTAVEQRLGNVDGDTTRLASIRTRPHDACFDLLADLHGVPKHVAARAKRS
jgi:hypothetical protein